MSAYDSQEIPLIITQASAPNARDSQEAVLAIGNGSPFAHDSQEILMTVLLFQPRAHDSQEVMLVIGAGISVASFVQPRITVNIG